MDFGIQGKKALVCAASKGLGKATALALAQEGAELFICARSETVLAETAREIEALAGRPVHYRACDLSRPESVDALVSAVNTAFGGPDILVHNAGGPKPSTVAETDTAAWLHGFEQNFLSITRLNQAFVPGMKRQGWGRIVAVTSISVAEPIANLAVSNAVRAAVTGMLKTLSDEVAPFGVTVNCVAPGVIHTDRTEERIQHQIAQAGGTREAYMQDYLAGIPMRRLGEPAEFAAVAAFLCAEQASYITGSTVFVDGGKRRSAY